MLNSPLAKGVLRGIAAYSVSRMLGGHHGRHHRRHGGGFFDFEGSDLGFDDIFEGDFGDFGGDDE